QVGELLSAAAVERDVCVAAARPGGWDAHCGRRGDLLGHDPESVAAVDGAEPRAALGAGPGGTAVEDAALRVDRDVGLPVGVNRIDDGRSFEGDRGGVRRSYSSAQRRQRDRACDKGHQRPNSDAWTNHDHTPSIGSGATRAFTALVLT